METTKEMKDGNKPRRSTARKVLKAWVEKDPDAHLKLSLAQIADQSGTSISTVKRYLANLIAECNGGSPDEVWAQRKAAGFSRGGSRRNKKPHSPTSPDHQSSETSDGVPRSNAVERLSHEVVTPPESESKDDRKVISGHFDKDLYRQFAHLAIDRDCSMQVLLVEALNLLFEKEGLPRF